MPKLDKTKLSAVRKLIKQNGYDGLVISDYIDMKYLLGEVFLAGEAILLVHQKGIFATARSLYYASVKENYKEITPEACDINREQSIIAAAAKLKLKKVAFDASKESYKSGKAYAAAKFIEGGSLIDSIRVAKTEEELKIMKKAAKIAYAGFEHISKFIKPGITEKEAALELERFLKSKGASALSFDTIAAFGAGGSNPHYATGDVKLKNEMPVLFDFGCVYNGYCSDITRSFWFGKNPDKEYTTILNLAKKAHAAVVKNAKEGMTGAQIDNLAREVIKDGGYGDYFSHGTGHGIGMQVHEEAYINQNNQTVKIKTNYCFSVEPGIYLTGKFGVRWEDCFYMTKKGIKKIA